MTRQEINQQIGERELSMGEILKQSAGILFEDLGKWLLLSLIVFLPTGFLLQYLMLQIPDDVLNVLFGAEVTMEMLAQLDMEPAIHYFGAQMAMSLVWIVAHLAAAAYTDRWLQSDKPLLGFGEMMKLGARRWPAGLLMPILLLLASFALSMVLLFGMMIFPFLVFLLLMGAFLISAVYYMGLTVTAIRNEKGIKAVKYAWSVVRAKKGRAIWLIAVMMLVNTVANMLLNSVTSSFYILLQFEWLYCFVSALLSVLANLPSVFLAIGVTIYFVNQEQLMQQIPVNVSFQELPEEVDV